MSTENDLANPCAMFHQGDPCLRCGASGAEWAGEVMLEAMNESLPMIHTPTYDERWEVTRNSDTSLTMRRRKGVP